MSQLCTRGGYEPLLPTFDIQLHVIFDLSSVHLNAHQLEGRLMGLGWEIDRGEVESLESTRDIVVRVVKGIQTWFGPIPRRLPWRKQRLARTIGTLFNVSAHLPS